MFDFRVYLPGHTMAPSSTASCNTYCHLCKGRLRVLLLHPQGPLWETGRRCDPGGGAQRCARFSCGASAFCPPLLRCWCQDRRGAEAGRGGGWEDADNREQQRGVRVGGAAGPQPLTEQLLTKQTEGGKGLEGKAAGGGGGEGRESGSHAGASRLFPHLRAESLIGCLSVSTAH